MTTPPTRVVSLWKFVVAIGAVILIVLLGVWFLVYHSRFAALSNDKQVETLRGFAGLGLNVAGALAGLFALWFTHRRLALAENTQLVTQATFRLSQESNLGGRYSSAVELLAKGEEAKEASVVDSRDSDPRVPGRDDGLSLRLGAIYMLEAVLHASKKWYVPILQLFESYLQKHCRRVYWNPVSDEPPRFEKTGKDYDDEILERLPPDVHAVLTAIGRRRWVDTESEPLNLTCLVLRGADFSGADLRNVLFSGSDLVYASFDGADIRGCKLYEANCDRGQMKTAQVDEQTVFPWGSAVPRQAREAPE